jgi:DNA recombination protein RmuC
MDAIVIGLLALNVLILVALFLIWKRGPGTGDSQRIHAQLLTLDQGQSTRFTDLAARLERTRGELNLDLTKELGGSLIALRTAVDQQLVQGREEQAASLSRAIGNLEQKFDHLAQRQGENAKDARVELGKSIEAMRLEVEKRLNDITGQVQQKLDENIREGFAQFEKVQEHLRLAEEQLRNVGNLGNSINDLNSLLKLPHLRGKFGEESLERLLQDFLPANMYDLQMGPANGNGRADAMIHFPERDLPIDAKFPREQVLALFDQDNAGPEAIAEARKAFERVMKEQAKRVRCYIQPENGTTDIALLYLPSETLYMETVRNRDLWEEMVKVKVLPVSPNTLLVTLQAISMVHKWYQLEKNLAKSIDEFNKARKSFEYFESKFEVIGKSLEKAQEAFATASGHLTRYKSRVTNLGGEGQPELGFEETENASAKDMSAKA